MTTQLTPKQQEIKLLEKLWNLNGYFADTFSDTDLAEMVWNIKNDLTILVNTHVSHEIMDLEEKLKKATNNLETALRTKTELIMEVDDLKNKIGQLEEIAELRKKDRTLLLEDLFNNDRDITLTDHFTEAEIIAAKIDNLIPLSATEKEYIKTRL